MERLRNHIKKGCLPGLLPGEGTEPNESLHHTLNKTRLCGVTTIGRELAFAILTLLFYSINCKIDGKKNISETRNNTVYSTAGFSRSPPEKSNQFKPREHSRDAIRQCWQVDNDNDKDYDILTKAPTIKNTIAVLKKHKRHVK